MKKKKYLWISLAAVCLLVLIILLLPKEEELNTRPVVEAYQNDDFDMEEVKQGDLIKKETIDLAVQNNGEKILSFSYDDFFYKGIYVKTGDRVSAGQLLAELSAQGKERMVSDSASLQLTAPFDGVVTYALTQEKGEKSVANQSVVIVSQADQYVVSAYTPYWSFFHPGDIYTATIQGKDVRLKVVQEEEIGVEKFPAPTVEGAPARVYFLTQEEGLLLHSGLPGSMEVTLDTRTNVLYIPSKAVNLVNGEEIVYVEDADGIRTIQSVKTGMNAGKYTEVIEGLSLGDKVIVD